MKLVYHGGKCCGVKNIHTLGYSPNDLFGEVMETFCKVTCDGGSNPMGSETLFFTGAAPQETAKKRLVRLLEFHDTMRSNGMIEVTTTSLLDQTEKWRPVLEENGFKEVASCFNSNSSRRVTFWLRCTDRETAPVQAKPAAVVFA